MKKIFLVLLIPFFGCKKDNMISRPCSNITSYEDTLIVGNYKLWLIALTSHNSGSLEVIDKNNNNIDGSQNFSINLVQLKNGNNCWETTTVSKATGSSLNSYDGLYNGAPTWSYDSNTKAIIQLTISGNQYYLIDEQVNK
jgi:hypothetical protein